MLYTKGEGAARTNARRLPGQRNGGGGGPGGRERRGMGSGAEGASLPRPTAEKEEGLDAAPRKTWTETASGRGLGAVADGESGGGLGSAARLALGGVGLENEMRTGDFWKNIWLWWEDINDKVAPPLDVE
jgi:hypothetical protein